jgi:hypothetical protein
VSGSQTGDGWGREPCDCPALYVGELVSGRRRTASNGQAQPWPDTDCLQSTLGLLWRYVAGSRSAGRKGSGVLSRTGRSTAGRRGLARPLAPRSSEITHPSTARSYGIHGLAPVMHAAGSRGGSNRPTACASCTPERPSAAVRADLWIWGHESGHVRKGSASSRVSWAPHLVPRLRSMAGGR